MNINLHSEGENNFIKNLKEELEERILDIKNSKELSIKSIKTKIYVLKKEYHKRIKNSKYNNF